MQADLDLFLAALAERRPARSPRELTPEMRELLEGLGYLVGDESSRESDGAKSN